MPSPDDLLIGNVMDRIIADKERSWSSRDYARAAIAALREAGWGPDATQHREEADVMYDRYKAAIRRAEETEAKLGIAVNALQRIGGWEQGCNWAVLAENALRDIDKPVETARPGK